jgi:hypothetical protein
MNRHAWLLIAGTILTLAGTIPRTASAQSALRPVSLLIGNEAGVPDEVLAGAMAEVARIYAKIGVDVAWATEAPTGTGLALSVSIVSHSVGDRMKIAATALGAAFEGGTLAYVVYDRVEHFASTCGNSITQLLGLTMVHELGHLLLGNRVHSASGIMREIWTMTDARAAAAGWLLFTPEQADLIRSHLAVRR